MTEDKGNVTPFPASAKARARVRRTRPPAVPSSGAQRLKGLADLKGAGLLGLPQSLYFGAAAGYLAARYVSHAERSSDWLIAAALVALGVL